jgi:thioredoxin-related protein
LLKKLKTFLKMRKIALLLLSTITIIACKSKTDERQTADSTAAIAADTVATATKSASAEETLCFEHKEGKDNTTVKLVINGDVVTGEMNWTQSEEKVFKIEGDKLLEKSGELVDGKDGKLVMKDPAKAKYMAGLVKIKCL